MNDPTDRDRLESALYGALNSFQQSADWPQLRLAQIRHHLAEHLATELTFTPGITVQAATPAPKEVPLAALESARGGATMLDAWAETPQGRNFLAHALVQLARDGWLRTAPGEGFEVVGDPVDVPEPQDPAAAPAGPAPATDGVAESALRAVETAMDDTLLPAAREEALAGIAAVLPATVDRAALAWFTEGVVERCPDHGCVEPVWADGCHCELVPLLRRLAGEAACVHPDGYDGECPCPPSCTCCTATAVARSGQPETAARCPDAFWIKAPEEPHTWWQSPTRPQRPCPGVDEAGGEAR